jgi:3-mercaptopyruvate sulfurtransferase SseA
MSNTLRPVFASWLGWLVELVEHDQRLVFILENDQDRADLVRQCLDVGHEHLVGEFAGGIDAWTGSGRPVASIPFVDVNDMTGASVLAARGHHDVVVFDGGPDSWSSATGRPLAVAE